jgi:putative CocE/NonD family hydrolase
MRYSVSLPHSTGTYPVLIEYDGYASGSAPNLGRRWLDQGYAVMGLNVPGTGCSSGDDRVFDATVGAAGAYAVEWAARQNWSNGRVGMVGDSYAGYNQLWVASQRPEHLLAIAPGKDVTDPYRDVGYPGGIQNIGFPAAWIGRFPAYWQAAAAVAKDDGDTTCEQTAAANIAKLRRPDLDWLRWLDTDPHYDALYAQRSAMFATGYIDIPTLGTQAWQDEQVGTRMGYYEDTLSPDKMWLISSNGTHETSYISDYVFEVQKRFYAHFVKGEDNGFEQEPHVHLLQELQTPKDPKATLAAVPTAVTRLDRLPVKVTPMRLWMQADGGLGADEPASAQAASSSYRYPVDSPSVNNPVAEGWADVSAPDGQLTFTTAALPQDLSYYGEGSVDLWLSTTDSDTDVQVTLSEVRPDGMEMFVQRGWLRASKRQLDESRSSTLRPWGDFTEASVKTLVPNEPTLLRVELQKFAHVFRAGSSLRVTIDTPSQTGYWVFGNRKTPSTNTVWHDKMRLSSIVIGYLPYAHASERPSCETTLRQPCRKNAVAVPTGVGPREPS